jgi:hypothetical protein
VKAGVNPRRHRRWPGIRRSPTRWTVTPTSAYTTPRRPCSRCRHYPFPSPLAGPNQRPLFGPPVPMAEQQREQQTLGTGADRRGRMRKWVAQPCARMKS